MGNDGPGPHRSRDRKACCSEHRPRGVPAAPSTLGGAWVVGRSPNGQPVGPGLPAPSAHRCSSLRLTWCTGAKPSSSTLCVRTTSTCCLPMPACVCEYLWLLEVPLRGSGYGGQGPPGVLPVSAPPLPCPASSSGLVQHHSPSWACAPLAPAASREGLRPSMLTANEFGTRHLMGGREPWP